MESENIIITKHAYERAKERLGWNKKTLKRMLPKVIDCGTYADDIKGFVKGWAQRKKDNKLNSIDELILYGNSLFLFKKKPNTTDTYILLTVVTAPSTKAHRFNECRHD